MLKNCYIVKKKLKKFSRYLIKFYLFTKILFIVNYVIIEHFKTYQIILAK